MRSSHISVAFIFLLLSPPLMAQAEIEFFAGAYAPASTPGGFDFDTNPLYGLRIGSSFLRFFGTEFSYTFISNLEENITNFEGNAHLFSGNFLVQLPVGKAVPFGTVGLGAAVGSSNGIIRLQDGFVWNAGGGLKVRELAGPLGFRFDIRYYRINDGLEFLVPVVQEVDFDFTEVSGGLLFTF